MKIPFVSACSFPRFRAAILPGSVALLGRLGFALVALTAPAWAEESAGEDTRAELTRQIANPTADLATLPLQSNWDYHIGPARATRYTLNIQPVVPLELNRDWNVIVRTVLPYIDAQSPIPGGATHAGWGDTVQSFFISPKAPTAHGWIWGAGPALLWPTASDPALGSARWGVGPTAALLRQQDGWTYGVLANHLWSYAGDRSRSEVNTTYLMPLLSYGFKTHTLLQMNGDLTYDWTRHQWQQPVNFQIVQMLKLGRQIISVGIGARYWADGPSGGPRWGSRFSLTFLFPKTSKTN